MAWQLSSSVTLSAGSASEGASSSHSADCSQEAVLDEGTAAYRLFMSALLDITDNLDLKGVVPPDNVVRHDDDDPYLVVAADKGTATFSDIANGISEEHGFWLHDAFASGSPTPVSTSVQVSPARTRPKKRGPDQWALVILLATLVSDG